jgi:hypothetical protein
MNSYNAKFILGPVVLGRGPIKLIVFVKRTIMKIED